MALSEQHLEVVFNQGADESQEDYIVEAPLTALVDYEFRKDRGVRKRFGWAPKGDLDVGLGAAALVPNGTQLGILSRNTLTGVGAAGIDADGSPRVQHTARVTSERFANIVDSADLQDCDVAYCTDGRVCVAATRYDGTAYSVVIAVFDTNGGLLHREVVASARRARVLAQGTGRFNIFYTSTAGNVISVRSIIGDPANGGTQSSTLGIVTNHATYKAYDVCNGLTTTCYLVFNDSTGSLNVALFSAAVAVQVSFDTAIATADFPSITFHPTNSRVYLAYGNRGTTGGKLLTVNSTPNAIVDGPTTVVAGTTVIRTAIAPMLDGGVNNPMIALFQDQTGSTTNVYAQYATAALGSLAAVELYQAQFNTAPFGLACGQFDTAAGPDRPYAAISPQPLGAIAALDVIPTSMLGMLAVGGQGTALGGGTGLTYTPRSFGPVVPLITDAAGAPVADGNVSRIPAGAGTTRYTAIPYIFDEADGTEHLAILVLKLDTFPPPAPVVTLGRNTFVGGGVLRFYDGQRFGELTPPWAPDSVAPTTVGAGSNPAAGVYNYCAYVEWTDGNGEVHRGPVTNSGALTHAGGSVDVVIRNHVPSLLDPTSTAQKWVIRLYRTLDAGASFYFIRQKEISAADSSVTLTDGSSDITASGHELLYTVGGILQAEAPPALKSLAVHRNRLWGISAEDPHDIWASKTKEAAIAVEFSSTLVRRVEATTDPRALASLDDKLIVFTGSDAYAILGDGPDATGVDSGSASWAPAEIVAPGVGATGGQAALTTPIGIIVHTPSGFKLLGRDLAAQDIGGALLDSAPGTTTVLRAVHFPNRQQAWFLLANSKIIVFDYARGKLRWCRFSMKNGTELPLDIANVNGTPYVLTDASSLYSMSTTAYDDDGVFVAASLTTGWIRPDGVLGEVQFRKVHLMGNRDTHSGVSCNIASQGGEPQAYIIPTILQSVVWTGTELAIQTPAHVSHRLKYQRAHALRFILLQVAGNAVDSSGFEPFGVGIEYGARRKASKTPASSLPG